MKHYNKKHNDNALIYTYYLNELYKCNMYVCRCKPGYFPAANSRLQSQQEKFPTLTIKHTNDLEHVDM